MRKTIFSFFQIFFKFLQEPAHNAFPIRYNVWGTKAAEWKEKVSMSMNLKEQYDHLYRYCYFKLHNREMAEDITQEAFLRLWEKGYYRDTGKTMEYLYVIARNLCVDVYRKRRFEVSMDPANLPEMTAEKAAGQEWSADSSFPDRLAAALTLQEALNSLEETDRELILLRFVNEVPIRAISEIMGISRFTIYRRTQKILKQLELFLGPIDR